jgi:hypothetical protein
MLCGAKTQRYVGLSEPIISPAVMSPSGALNSHKMEDHGLIFELAESLPIASKIAGSLW